MSDSEFTKDLISNTNLYFSKDVLNNLQIYPLLITNETNTKNYQMTLFKDNLGIYGLVLNDIERTTYDFVDL